MNLCIIDLEATCDENNRAFDMETIEIGAVIKTPTETYYFQSFVKPYINPVLTDFCKNLTSITQEQVDRAASFPLVLGKFVGTLEVLLGKNWRDHTLLCSWGAYDKKQLVKDCERCHATFPFNGWHLNIKREFLRKYPKAKGRHLGYAAEYLGIPWEGTAHRGINDAKMIAKILEAMQSDGYQLPAVIVKSLEESDEPPHPTHPTN